MSIPDNLTIRYYASGKICLISEVDDEDRRDGIFAVWLENGRLTAEHNYVKNKQHGLACRWYSCGAPEEQATYVHGMLHGLYQSFYSTGNIHYTGHYIHGKRHGVHRVFYSDGTISEVEYYVNGNYLTKHIKKIVADIHNVTEKEKTLIAIQLGIIL